MDLPSDERWCAGGLPQLVAGTASRVRWQPYLTVLAYSCRINNRKELHFWFGSRPRGNSQNVVRTVRVVQKTTTGDIAQTVYFYLIRGPRQGRAPRPARRAGVGNRPDPDAGKAVQFQAAASSRLNEPLTRALRPFSVMAGTRPSMLTRPSVTRSSSASRVGVGNPAMGTRRAFNASHWSGRRSKSFSSLMLPRFE